MVRSTRDGKKACFYTNLGRGLPSPRAFLAEFVFDNEDFLDSLAKKIVLASANGQMVVLNIVPILLQ